MKTKIWMYVHILIHPLPLLVEECDDPGEEVASRLPALWRVSRPLTWPPPQVGEVLDMPERFFFPFLTKSPEWGWDRSGHCLPLVNET